MRITTAHPHRVAALALAVLVIAAAVPGAALAVPSTPEIEAKRSEAAAAQAELGRMNVALEIQVEEYNAISEALEQTRVEIQSNRKELELAEVELAAARARLSGRAASIYKDGRSGVLDVFLGARSFDDFVVRLDLAVRINRSDADMVTSVKEAKARVEVAANALEQRQAEQTVLQGEAGSRASRIAADVAAQERFIGELDGEIRSLIAQEEERQRKLAEERARQALLAAQAAAAQKGSSGSTRGAADPSSLGPGHPEVVPIALRFLGVPYVWGSSSPTGFDCSGLTSYVYRQVGISLQRTSQSQFNQGKHIDRERLDLLKPGDLVFFGTNGDANRVHHVGIYVGDGNYVHAPYTGTVVRVDSLTARISSRADYVGASRM